jgi:hypothetical protein
MRACLHACVRATPHAEQTNATPVASSTKLVGTTGDDDSIAAVSEGPTWACNRVGCCYTGSS